MAATIIRLRLRAANDNPDWLPPAPTSSAQRRMLESTIERLIDLLDASDFDCDLEDDDPAGDPLDFGEAQETTEVMATLPIYGIDQSLGPVNEAEACHAHLALEREAA